jgi:hypothetical protein
MRGAPWFLVLGLLLLPLGGASHVVSHYYVLNGVLEPPLGSFYIAVSPGRFVGADVCPGFGDFVRVPTKGATNTIAFLAEAGPAEAWTTTIRHENLTWDGVVLYTPTSSPYVQGTGTIRYRIGEVEEFRLVVNGFRSLYLC